MKKTILTSAIAFIAAAFLVIGCNKSNTSSPSTADENGLQSKVTQNAQDQANIQNDEDAKANDATTATETVPAFGNLTGNISHIATFGVTDSVFLDSTTSRWFIIDKTPFKLKIPRIVLWYRGLMDSSGFVKRGKITVQLINGKKWTDVGAELKETDSVYVTFNGKTRFYACDRYITNVSGGYKGINTLPNPFIYTMHAYGSVTFDDGSQRTYWVTRKNTFTKTAPYTFSVAGDTTINSVACTIGGTTRYGENFLVQAPQAIASNLYCGYFNPTSGIRILTFRKEPVTITYGVDAAGNQVTSGCAYGYKINWTKLNGNVGTAVIAY